MEILGRNFEQVKIVLGNESFKHVISYRYSKLDYFVLVSLREIETNKKFEAVITYNNDMLDNCYIGLYEVTEYDYTLCERLVEYKEDFFTYLLEYVVTKISLTDISLTDISGNTTFNQLTLS